MRKKGKRYSQIHNSQFIFGGRGCRLAWRMLIYVYIYVYKYI